MNKRFKDPYPFRLRVKISQSISTLENWLDANCEGAYAYEFDGIKETDAVFAKLEILFKFAFDTDRQRFKSAIRSGEV